MTVISRILILLGLKSEPSIESITSPMAAIVRKLESYAVEQTKRAEEDAKRADELIEKSRKENACARDARNMADRYSALTATVPAE